MGYILSFAKFLASSVRERLKNGLTLAPRGCGEATDHTYRSTQLYIPCIFAAIVPVENDAVLSNESAHLVLNREVRLMDPLMRTNPLKLSIATPVKKLRKSSTFVNPIF